jgi:WD40 repeat protein
MEGHIKRINCLIVTPTEAYEDTIVVSGSADTTVRYWRLKTGKLHVLCNGHKWEVMSVCFCKGRGIGFESDECSMDRKIEV